MPFYGLFALAVLMIVHESGHYFAARAFNMRVERFSIGFGPAIWRHKPKDSPTTYQLALIPFLAYVQIAGMNPFEEIDPDDEGSYANASLVGRISAIIAGPLANYVFASLVLFASLMIGGKVVETTRLEVSEGGAAMTAGLESGDRVIAIDGQAITKWDELQKTVIGSPGKKLMVRVERDGKPVELAVVPRPLAKDGGGLIGVRPEPVPMPVIEAAQAALVQPALIVGYTVKSLYRWISGKEKGQLTGPIGMMRETEKAAELGLPVYLQIVAFLSTSVGFFNMLPLPALDGGRLIFLAYEAVTRRQPNQKLEGRIHGIGMLMLLVALAFVSFREWGSNKTPSEEAAQSEKSQPEKKSAPSQSPAPSAP